LGAATVPARSAVKVRRLIMGFLRQGGFFAVNVTRMECKRNLGSLGSLTPTREQA
jgi:hypothetical protein